MWLQLFARRQISQTVELFLQVYLSRWIFSEVNIKLPSIYLSISILATIFNVSCDAARTLSNNAILYLFTVPLLLLTVTKWCTERNSNTRFQCVSQKYCQYLITVACIRQTLFESAKPNQQFTRRGKQHTSDDEANVITGRFIAHWRDLFPFYCSGSRQSHLSSMGDRVGAVCACVCVWDK